MTKIKHETIWITGATSGIGLELAKQLACNNNTLIISGRNQSVLSELCDTLPNTHAVVFDVADRNQVATVSEQLQAVTTKLDRVVLNAGNCLYFSIEKPEWNLMRDIAEVNYFGMVNSIEAAFPLLKSTANSHIVGICSQAINAPFPEAEAYGGSKAAASYFLSSLRIDLKKLGIDVSIIHPGFVDTPLTQKNKFSMPFLMTVENACQRIIKSIERRDRQHAFPKRLSALLAISKIAPRLWEKNF